MLPESMKHLRTIYSLRTAQKYAREHYNNRLTIDGTLDELPIKYLKEFKKHVAGTILQKDIAYFDNGIYFKGLKKQIGDLAD